MPDRCPTKTERRYRARLRAIVQARIDAGATMAELSRACFHPATKHTRASNKPARRKLEREMGTDPGDRTSDGVKWETLESLARGLGCSVGDLLG